MAFKNLFVHIKILFLIKFVMNFLFPMSMNQCWSQEESSYKSKICSKTGETKNMSTQYIICIETSEDKQWRLTVQCTPNHYIISSIHTSSLWKANKLFGFCPSSIPSNLLTYQWKKIVDGNVLSKRIHSNFLLRMNMVHTGLLNCF